MNHLSRFARALSPVCALFVAGAATLGATRPAQAKAPTFGSTFSPHKSISRQPQDAFVRVGVATNAGELPTELAHVGGFSTLLGSTTPAASGWRLAAAGDPIVIAFADNTVEVNEGAGNVVLTVTRSGDVLPEVTVNYQTNNGPANGGAVDPTDFSSRSGIITFRRNETTKTITVPIIDDQEVEGSQIFTVALSLPAGTTNQSISNSPATVAIIDNDATIQLDTATATANEGDGFAELTLVRDGSIGSSARVTFTTTPGTATTPEDFTNPTSLIVNFAANQDRATFRVPLVNDTLDEVDETFTVTLTGVTTPQGPGTNVLGNNKETVVTIQDDDSTQVGFTTTTRQVSEGIGSVEVTVTRSGDITRAIAVDYTTANGSAIGSQDYTPTSGTLTFAANQREQTITVSITDDNEAENTENFEIRLSAARFDPVPEGDFAVTIAPSATFTVSILDNEAQANFSVTSFEVDERTTILPVTVTRAPNSATTSTVNFATSNISAIAGQDYVANSGTLTFGPNESSKTIELRIIDDASDENAEQFRITLSNPSAPLQVGPQASALITIIDNDDVPTISVTDKSVDEGNDGQKDLTFTITLSAPSGRPVSVGYATANGTATVADQDYVAKSGVLPFVVDPATGSGPQSLTVSIPIIGDTKFEDDEGFIFALSNPSNATLGVSRAVGRIVNDDPAPTSNFTISPATTSIAENAANDTLTFTITRRGDLTNPASVTVSTVEGTAIAGSDFNASSRVLNFAANTTSLPFTVSINDDSVNEANETFTVALSNPTTFVGTATLETPSTSTVTIVNDDPGPILDIGPASVEEGDSGTTNLVFQAALKTSSEQTVSVRYTTVDGTATVADRDYIAKSGILSFAPGQLTSSIVVSVIGDTKLEDAETLSLLLSNPQNLTLNTNSVVGTIVNDEVPASNISFAATAVQVNEAAGNAVLTLRRTEGLQRAVTVNYATSNGTATAPADYTARSGTITFPVNQATATIQIPIVNDTLQETGDPETFTVILSAPGSNATLSDQRVATVSIVDNEGVPTLSIANTVALEGTGGRTFMSFTVSLFPQSKSQVTVVGTTTATTPTTERSATPNQDFRGRSGNIVFAPGQSTQTFLVEVAADVTLEQDETFGVQLSNPVGAPIARNGGLAIGTILNDDELGNGGEISFLGASYAVSENVNDPSATPANSVRITLGRSGKTSESATVRFTTGVGTATANSDYRPVNVIVTFPAGQSTTSVLVPIINNNLFENDETVPLTISNPSINAILGSMTTATLTIVDDDPISTTPRADGISPVNIVGKPFTVTTNFSSDLGTNDFAPVFIQFGGNQFGAGGFRASYYPRPANNRLTINPTPEGGVFPGTNTVLTNQFGSLYVNDTKIVRTGNTLSVTWRITLTSNVALPIYTGATGSRGESVIFRKGTWYPATTTSAKGS